MDFSKCIKYVKEKHEGQKRKQGTPYYLHPLHVCKILQDKGFSWEYQVVGLFHDLLEDTDATYEEILELSNAEIAEAVKVLTKKKKPKYVESEYIEGIKKNELSKMVKIADRIHNLSEAHHGSMKFQNKYLKETKEWFLDLAKDTVFEEDLNREHQKLADRVNSYGQR